MSDLNQLRARLDQIGREASGTANSLATFGSRFGRQVGEIESTIGGTATGVDKNMIATLQAAERQLSQAVAALQQVAVAASRYATAL
jgi:hypothetical protein